MAASQPALSSRPQSAREYWDVGVAAELSGEQLDQLLAAADGANAAGGELTLRYSNSLLTVQLETLRLHRRVELEYQGQVPANDVAQQRRTDYVGVLQETSDWRTHPNEVLEQLRHAPANERTELFHWLLAAEDDAYELNRIRPYEDVIPVIICDGDPELLAPILSALGGGQLARVLFGNYTRILPTDIARVLRPLSAKQVAACVSASALDRDWIRECGELLRELEPTKAEAVFSELSADIIFKVVSCTQQVPHAHELLERMPPSGWPSLLAYVKSTHPSVLPAVQCHATSARPRVGANDAVSHSSRTRDMDPRGTNWMRVEDVDAFSSASGKRIEHKLDFGRWIRIEESLNSGASRENILIDLLELNPERISLRCYEPETSRPQLNECDELFGSEPVNESKLRQTGLFRLAEVAAKQQAVAAINGNFYFDYGHYDYSKRLGVDCARFPNMRFGDPFGWFVRDGVESCNATLNRAALAITDDDRIHIRRVKMTAIQCAGGKSLSWDIENSTPETEQVALYTSIWGTDTPTLQYHRLVSVVGSRVVAAQVGGQVGIPPTGFVLAFPKSHWTQAVLGLGTEVIVQNDFPESLGSVREAIACGPLLVRNGEIDVDFALEEFGSKDSSVISFFLPRLYESYRAARSFLGLKRNGQLLLGVVTGRAFGAGKAGVSAGLTFGELAQLARDVGAETAMNLDGGGSSSLVCDLGEGMRPLNIPTGGTDVPRGQERFIGNGILVYAR